MSTPSIIPVSAATRWREVRARWLPVVVFGLTTLVAVFLWRNLGTAWTIAGFAEGIRSQVSSPCPGLLLSVLVQPHQPVSAGDPLAVVLPRDPRRPFDVLQAELGLARLRLQPSLAQENAVDLERLRSDLFRTQTELALARVNFERADKDFRRNEPLYREQLVSEEVFDLSQKTRELYQAEIEEKSRVVAEMRARLEPFQDPDGSETTDSEEYLEVAARLEGLRQNATNSSAPITLTAPIDGIVNGILRQPGESVIEGEPLLVLNAPAAERIVGYLRQPYPVDPFPGMTVRVHTRDRRRQVFWSEVTQVGAQLEPITNHLAILRLGALVDAGLPLIIRLPKDVELRPGEAVDLQLYSSGDALPARSSAANR